MAKGEGSGLTKSLKQGTVKVPPGVDASMKLPKGPSVDSDSTRKAVAKSHAISKGRTA